MYQLAGHQELSHDRLGHTSNKQVLLRLTDGREDREEPHHEDWQGLVHQGEGAVLHLPRQHALAVDQRHLLDLQQQSCRTSVPVAVKHLRGRTG